MVSAGVAKIGGEMIAGRRYRGETRRWTVQIAAINLSA
jgi:hypothetical protein